VAKAKKIKKLKWKLQKDFSKVEGGKGKDGVRSIDCCSSEAGADAFKQPCSGAYVSLRLTELNDKLNEVIEALELDK